jgi:N-methylhydantoinase A
MALDVDAARRAVADGVGGALGAPAELAAFAIAEVVDENMANAARVHAIERGRDVRRCTLVAFGGAAPLHACRLADKLGIDHIVVPEGAGVGSAIGFLRAPVSYEAVRTRHQRLSSLDTTLIEATLAEMAEEARAVVGAAAPGAETVAEVRASMRYVGQGHEVEVPGPAGGPLDGATPTIADAGGNGHGSAGPSPVPGRVVSSERRRPAWDAASAAWLDHATFERADLEAGDTFEGPALVAEAQTTTVVAAGFVARRDGDGNLVLHRRSAP